MYITVESDGKQSTYCLRQCDFWLQKRTCLMIKNDKTNENHFLKVARIKNISRVLGPGERTVIWFYGCSKKCPGCIAQSMNSSGEFYEYTPKDLATLVLDIPNTHGITISGGEPFEQDATALGEFLSLVQQAGKSIICYSGMRYEDILCNLEKRVLLNSLDLLIDGEYREEQNNGSTLRGSDNQRFIFLSDRFTADKDKIFCKGREIEFDIGIDNTLEITGIPERGFLKKIEREFESRGIEISW